MKAKHNKRRINKKSNCRRETASRSSSYWKCPYGDVAIAWIIFSAGSWYQLGMPGEDLSEAIRNARLKH